MLFYCQRFSVATVRRNSYKYTLVLLKVCIS